MDKAVNTTDDLILCSKCRESLHSDGPKIKLKDYIKSIEYINSCHSILNQMVSKRKCDNQFSLPDVPNFFSVFSMVYNEQKGNTNVAHEVENTELHHGEQKEKYLVHELDNIESLEEITSCIDSLDVNGEKKRCNTTDSDIESEKTPVYRRRKFNNGNSDEENCFNKNCEKYCRNSSIPRPVSMEKGHNKCEESIRSDNLFTKQSTTKRTGRHEAKQEAKGKEKQPHLQLRTRENKVMMEKGKHQSEVISKDELTKYAMELLKSKSPNSPRSRSLSSNSGSPSPRNRKINVWAPSKPKEKANSGRSKHQQQNHSPTIGDSFNTHKKTEHPAIVSDISARRSVSPGYNTPRESNNAININANLKSQMSINSEENGKAKSEQHERNESNSKNYDDTYDKKYNILPVKNSFRIKSSSQNHLRSSKDQNRPDGKYVVREMPVDTFMQPRWKRDERMNKPPIDTHNEIRAYNSGSDLLDDGTEKKPVRREPVIDNTYSILKASMTRKFSASFRSAGGPSSQARYAKDKHPPSRQSRHRTIEVDSVRKKRPVIIVPKDCSPSSSDIKTDDEEEIRSYMIDRRGYSNRKQSK